MFLVPAAIVGLVVNNQNRIANERRAATAQAEHRRLQEAAVRQAKQLADMQAEQARAAEAARVKDLADAQAKAQQAEADRLAIAQHIPAIEITGRSIGLFGLISSGKSTLVNSLLGRQEAKVGLGDTTTLVTPYQGIGYTLWDAPGYSDEYDYTTGTEQVAFLKALSLRIVVVTATINSIIKFLTLLQQLSLPTVIVVNKCDLAADTNELLSFKAKIAEELTVHGLTCDVYFISAVSPSTFTEEWDKLVMRVTSC